MTLAYSSRFFRSTKDIRFANCKLQIAIQRLIFEASDADALNCVIRAQLLTIQVLIKWARRCDLCTLLVSLQTIIIIKISCQSVEYNFFFPSRRSTRDFRFWKPGKQTKANTTVICRLIWLKQWLLSLFASATCVSQRVLLFVVASIVLWLWAF